MRAAIARALSTEPLLRHVERLSPGPAYLVRFRPASEDVRGDVAARRIATRAAEAVEGTIGATPWTAATVLRPQRRPRDAISEVSTALMLANQIWDQPRVLLAEDVFPVLLLLQDRDVAAGLAAVLDPLDRSESRGGIPLITSLIAFLDAGLSAAAAARALGLHRHTLEYRLRKAEALLGRSVSDPWDRLVLELALAARRTLGNR